MSMLVTADAGVGQAVIKSEGCWISWARQLRSPHTGSKGALDTGVARAFWRSEIKNRRVDVRSACPA